MSCHRTLLGRVATALLSFVLVAACATAALAADFTITVSSNPGGTVTPGTTTVAAGADQAFSIEAYTCYSVSDVQVDAVSVGPVTSYTFTNVQAPHTLTISFGPSPATSTSLDVTPLAGSCAKLPTLHSHVTNAVGGSVRWYEGAMLIGDAYVDGAGDASLTAYAFPAGTHSLVARYDGGLCGQTSQSAPLAYVVSAQTPTILLDASPTTASGAVTMVATVTDGVATLAGASGSIDFYSDGAYLGSASLRFGLATLSSPVGMPGDHAVTARYAGGPCLSPATSAPVTIHVIQAVGSIALTSSGSPSGWGSPVTFSAAVRADGAFAPWATGTMTFTIDGVAAATQPVSNGIATYTTSALATGVHAVRADYTGSGSVTAANATISQTVGRGTSHVALTSPSNPIGGQDVTFTATITPSGATGTVTFVGPNGTFAVVPVANSQASAAFHAPGQGTFLIQATYSGDVNLSASGASLQQQFLGTATTTALLVNGSGPPLSPQQTGNIVVLTANVTPSAATGGVEFTAFGNTLLGTVQLVSGHASITYVIPAGSSVVITATYLGNGNYGPSSTFLSIPITAPPPRTPTTTALTSSRSLELVDHEITYSATVSPASVTGTVSFRQGAGLLGTAPVSSGHAALTTTTPALPGQYVISATYDGDATYATSSTAITQGVVTILPTTVQIVTPANPSPALTIPVTVNVLPPDATGTVQLTDDIGFSDTQPVASGVATFSYTAPEYARRQLSARYSGDATHLPGVGNLTQEFGNGTQPTATSLTQDRPNSATGEWVQFVARLNVVVDGTVQFFVDGVPAATVGMVGGLGIWETFALTPGFHVVRAHCNPNSTYQASDASVAHWVLDYLPGVLRVQWPNSHEVLTIGTTVQLLWDASSAGTVPHVTLYASRVDNPPVWEPIAENVPNTGVYDWLVTGPESQVARIAVIDLGGKVGSDASDLRSTIYDIATPALITKLDATAVDEGIRVRWGLASGADIAAIDVERALAAEGPWQAIGPERVSANGETTALDRTVEAGKAYWYRLVATTSTGTRLVFGPVSAVPGAPAEFALGAPAPNPARHGFRLEFAVARTAPVRLALLDVQGRTVDVLADAVFAPGRYAAAWDGRSRSGPLATGLYFLQYRTPGKTFTTRVAIVK